MVVFCYYSILYFCTVMFGVQIIYFAEPFFTMFMAPDSIEIFICMLIMSSVLSIILSIILHYIYIWIYDSETFLKRFYQVHFFATYISGAFSLVMVGETTLKAWGFKMVTVDGNTKVTYLILLFIALSNNAFYKAFESTIVEKLEFRRGKMKNRIKKIKNKLGYFKGA